MTSGLAFADPRPLSVSNIVVLGCGGFVGSHLLDRLLVRDDVRVVGWDPDIRKIERHLGHPHLTVHRTTCNDPSVLATLEAAIEAADVVLNLAAICNPSEYNTRPLSVIRSNLVDVYPIVDLCTKHRRWLIHFSTSEVYGRTISSYVDTNINYNQDLYSLKEDETPLIMGPIGNQRWTYACAKQLIERVIYAQHSENGLPFTIVRPLNFFGPRMDYIPGRDGEGVPRVLACFMAALLDRTPMRLVDGGTARRTIVSIEEAIEALLLMLGKPDRARNTIFNIGNPRNEVTIAELAVLMREVYADITDDPSYLSHPIEAVSALDFYGPGYEDCDRRMPDVSKALDLLGWQPTRSVRDILLHTMRDYHERYAGAGPTEAVAPVRGPASRGSGDEDRQGRAEAGGQGLGREEIVGTEIGLGGGGRGQRVDGAGGETGARRSAPASFPSDGDRTGRTLGSPELDNLRSVLESGTLTVTHGRFAKAFEAAAARCLGLDHVTTCNSGTAAVHAAVAALDPEPGSEFVVSPLTDFGGVAPILWQGSIPVFADVDPATGQMTAATVGRCIGPRTRAIIVTHLFGAPAPVDEIAAHARQHGIAVIEDCAQAYLATLDGRPVGTFGDIATFSMQQTKHIGTGEGGFVATADPKLAARMRQFINKARNYADPEPDHHFLAMNYRMTELEAAVAVAQLERLPDFVAARRAAARRLDAALAASDLFGRAADQAGSVHTFWRYPIVVASAEGLVEEAARRLKHAGIASAPHYKPPAYRWTLFRDRRTFGTSSHPFSLARPGALDLDEGRFPGVAACLARMLVLPWNERLEDAHVDLIAETLLSCERAPRP